MSRVNSMIEQNGVVYYLEEVTTKVIEKYDEHLTACIKDTDYNFVRGYFGEVKELDLSWIRTQDVIELKGNAGLSKVCMNCTNAKNAALNIKDKIVCDINVDCNVVVAGSALKRFLANNAEVVAKINFKNVYNTIIKTYLEDMCSKYGVETSFIDFAIELEQDLATGELVA